MVVYGTQPQVLADSMAIAASTLNHCATKTMFPKKLAMHIKAVVAS